jgi:hypothetical protein
LSATNLSTFLNNISDKKSSQWPRPVAGFINGNGGGGVHLITACITYRIRLSEIQDSKNTVINTVILVELPIKKSAKNCSTRI